MKLIALFGLSAGAIVALRQLSAAQWHALGAALVVLARSSGLTALPWLLAILFALLWLRQRDITRAFRDGYLDKIVNPGTRKRAQR